jgi:trimethylamine--corrinoid protein Co-methyltransferase
VLDEQSLDLLQAGVLEVLERTGVLVEDEAAADILSDGGCLVDRETHMVRIPSRVALDCLELAPSSVLLAGRDRGRDIVLERGRMSFSNHCEAAFVNDWRTGEHRPSLKRDIADAARMVDGLSDVDLFIAPVIAGDYPVATTVHQYAAAVSNTTKPVHALVTDARAAAAIIGIASEVVGGPDELRARPIVNLGCSPVSPLQLTKEFTDCLLVCVRAGVPMLPMAMPVAGATSPVTLAGTLCACAALQVATVTLAQLAEPRAPMVAGFGGSTMDMRTGLMTSGSPEMALLAAGGAALARRYDMPSQVTAMWTDSKLSDGQSSHQKTLGGLASALSGASVIHGCGGLDGGLTFDWGELAVDNEICRMIRRIVSGITVSDATLLVDDICGIGPAGDFLQSGSTLQHARELLDPELIDRRPRERWLSDPTDLAARGKAEAKRVLEEHRPEPLPEDVARRVAAALAEFEASVTARV